jgi:hypothetical protein
VEKVFEPKSGAWDELKSEWVGFPNGKSYLLPVIMREQTIKPVFGTDKVTVEVQCADEKLGPLVDGYIATVLEVKDTGGIQSEESLGAFFGLIRHLLLRNYAFTDEQLTAILTSTNQQIAVLFAAITKHVTRK